MDLVNERHSGKKDSEKESHRRMPVEGPLRRTGAAAGNQECQIIAMKIYQLPQSGTQISARAEFCHFELIFPRRENHKIWFRSTSHLKYLLYFLPLYLYFFFLVESDVNNTMLALEAYYAANNTYTSTLSDLGVAQSTGVTLAITTTAPIKVVGTDTQASGTDCPKGNTYTLTQGSTPVWN